MSTQGTLEAICVSTAKRGTMEQVPEAALVAGAGIVGDRHFRKAHPKPEEELTLIAAEEIEAFNARTGLQLDHAAVRRNLVTVNVPLNDLVGRRFFVGKVEVEGMELCEPCAIIGKLLATEDVTSRAIVGEFTHRAGLRARIHSSGTIRCGDTIQWD